MLVVCQALTHAKGSERTAGPAKTVLDRATSGPRPHPAPSLPANRLIGPRWKRSRELAELKFSEDEKVIMQLDILNC